MLFGIPKVIPPDTVFGLDALIDSLSPFRSGRPPDVDEVYDGRLGAGAAASSSSLNVRSITALAGLLLLEGLDEAVDCSREDAGGVRCNGENRGPASCFSAWTRMSCISTRSSSSSGLAALVPLDAKEVSTATFSDHDPSGSIVTCSTDCSVLAMMSSTYLSRISKRSIRRCQHTHQPSIA